VSKYHFIGIGGVGMSALAESALLAGNAVTGSDRLHDESQDTPVLNALVSMGAVLFPQDGSGITNQTDSVVISTAIEGDNPDLLSAQSTGVDVIHRSQMLGLLTQRSARRIAVTGTCGKSTVTGMIGWMLAHVEKDPSVINGAPLADWMSPGSVGSARQGSSGICVFEADESDKSLMNYGCDVCIVTNSSADHFSKEESDDLLSAFAKTASEHVVDARQDAFFSDVGIGEGQFAYKDVAFSVPMPGRHNVLNSVIAVKVCEYLGCDLELLARGLREFRGVSRRLEYVGRESGTCVYDDYAHNTEKIRASWTALASRYHAVVGIWRPHGYGPLRSMMDDLVEMFSATVRSTDKLVLLPVYDAGGTADRSINSDALADRLRERGVNVSFVKTPEEAIELATRQKGDGAVVTLGARDPMLPVIAQDILKALL
jgi:UDP-N-acetylmuramate--alanine ligase